MSAEALAQCSRAVTLEGLDKRFGELHVVKDLHLQVERGEFVVLLGPSGCGKTTALRTIAGLEQADAGRILIGGRDVTRELPKYRDVAMVFQSYALYPHMTVARNIGYPLMIQGVPRAEREAAVRRVAEQVQLGEQLERYPRQLSGGQRQRVALARAIVRRPSVFLMDEPLSNLDAKLRTYMRAELKRLQYELGVTTIYVTHDQIEAMTLAHRVAVMDTGVIQQMGTPREIYSDPENLFVAGFIGSPPMNFLRGEAADGRLRYAAGIERPLPVRAPAHGEVILGIRPEDARVGEPAEGGIPAQVYAAELSGDYTLVTVTVGGEHVAVKADKSYEPPLDASVTLHLPPEACYFFDARTGARLR